MQKYLWTADYVFVWSEGPIFLICISSWSICSSSKRESCGPRPDSSPTPRGHPHRPAIIRSHWGAGWTRSKAPLLGWVLFRWDRKWGPEGRGWLVLRLALWGWFCSRRKFRCPCWWWLLRIDWRWADSKISWGLRVWVRFLFCDRRYQAFICSVLLHLRSRRWCRRWSCKLPRCCLGSYTSDRGWPPRSCRCSEKGVWCSMVLRSFAFIITNIHHSQSSTALFPSAS